MKKIAVIPFIVMMLSGCGILSNVSWDQAKLQQAAGAALQAVTISDAQVIALSQKTVAELDAKNALAPESYQRRLSSLLDKVGDVEGLKLNYKVYKTDEVNAFACGDGSIRVYSGLMDIMDDAELMAIIGHECGHVVHQDTKKAMRNAYLAAAARGVIGASNTTVGALSRTVLGDLGESFLSSQYSQQQEYAADEYGFKFSTGNGYDAYSMCKALEKLVSLSGGSKSSLVQKMFASHPDSAKRAEKMRQKADAYKK